MIEEKTYKIVYRKQFLEDIQLHKRAGRKSVLVKLAAIIEELKKHPMRGTGKPEPLIGDRRGQWSRRITAKHRLIYEIYEDVVTVDLISAAGYYGDK